MVSGLFGEVYTTLSGGIVVCLDVVRNQFTESDDSYFKIPVLGKDFLGKRERAITYLVFTLVGAFGVGLIKTSIVGAVAADPRLFVSCLGALLVLGPFVINDRENWNVNDGRLYGTGLLVIGALLVFGPWIGPPLLDYFVRMVTSIVSGVISYLVAGVTSITTHIVERVIGGITGFIASLPIKQIVAALLVLSIPVLLFRKQD